MSAMQKGSLGEISSLFVCFLEFIGGVFTSVTVLVIFGRRFIVFLDLFDQTLLIFFFFSGNLKTT